MIPANHEPQAAWAVLVAVINPNEIAPASIASPSVAESRVANCLLNLLRSYGHDCTCCDASQADTLPARAIPAAIESEAAWNIAARR